jgi:hypothetical protein
MKRIGLPKDCKLVDLQCLHFPGSPCRPNDYPEVDAVFQPMPFGYRINDSFGRYDLCVDALDGTVIAYLKREFRVVPYAIESHAAVVKLSEALDAARTLGKKDPAGVGRSEWGAAFEPGAKPTQLMLVCPNGEYGGLKYDRSQHPVLLRLAWVFFYPRSVEVWIDAADGKVLGGYSRRLFKG